MGDVYFKYTTANSSSTALKYTTRLKMKPMPWVLHNGYTMSRHLHLLWYVFNTPNKHQNKIYTQRNWSYCLMGKQRKYDHTTFFWCDSQMSHIFRRRCWRKIWQSDARQRARPSDAYFLEAEPGKYGETRLRVYVLWWYQRCFFIFLQSNIDDWIIMALSKLKWNCAHCLWGIRHVIVYWR